jgi:hypothetical protein
VVYPDGDASGGAGAGESVSLLLCQGTFTARCTPAFTKGYERLTKKRPPPKATVLLASAHPSTAGAGGKMLADVAPGPEPRSARHSTAICRAHGKTALMSQNRHFYRVVNTLLLGDVTPVSKNARVEIAVRCLPGRRCGRLFIGFPTRQTTGISVHIAAPFIPTVRPAPTPPPHAPARASPYQTSQHQSHLMPCESCVDLARVTPRVTRISPLGGITF